MPSSLPSTKPSRSPNGEPSNVPSLVPSSDASASGSPSSVPLQYLLACGNPSDVPGFVPPLEILLLNPSVYHPDVHSEAHQVFPLRHLLPSPVDLPVILLLHPLYLLLVIYLCLFCLCLLQQDAWDTDTLVLS